MRTHRLLVWMAMACLLVLIGVGLWYIRDWQWIVEHELAFRRLAQEAPLRTWLVGVIVYTALSLIPGTAGKSIVCGWLFGFWGALTMVEIGLTAAAVVSFLISRRVIRAKILRRWQRQMNSISQRFERHGAVYLLLLRFAHAPFTMVNYAAGATNIPLTTFAWTTSVGLLPGTIAFTLAGSQLPSLAVVVERGPHAIVDPKLVAVLFLTALIPLAIERLIRRYLHRRTKVSTMTTEQS